MLLRDEVSLLMVFFVAKRVSEVMSLLGPSSGSWLLSRSLSENSVFVLARRLAVVNLSLTKVVLAVVSSSCSFFNADKKWWS